MVVRQVEVDVEVEVEVDVEVDVEEDVEVEVEVAIGKERFCTIQEMNQRSFDNLKNEQDIKHHWQQKIK